jgi:hypothetical protein
MIMKRVPTAAQLLGFAGLLPFFGLTLAIWAVLGTIADDMTEEQVAFRRSWAGFLFFAQLLYTAIIVTFLGAVHWGLAMANLGWERQRSPVGPRINDGGEGTPRMEGPTRQMLWSVVPSLFAWAILLAFQLMQTGRLALVAMMILVFVCYRADHNAARFDLGPEWYVELRRVLTIAVLIALAGTFAAMMGW